MIRGLIELNIKNCIGNNNKKSPFIIDMENKKIFEKIINLTNNHNDEISKTSNELLDLIMDSFS
jgi:hypothetical protein